MKLPNQCQPVSRKSLLSFSSRGQVYAQQFNLAVEELEPEPVPLTTTTCWYRRNGTVRRCQTISS